MQPLLKGMPARMAVLNLGMLQGHEHLYYAVKRGYVVQTTAGETILIDGDLSSEAERDPPEDRQRSLQKYRPTTPENMLRTQLKLLGLGLDDIDLIIQSHTPRGNAASMNSVSDAPILMAQPSVELPHTPHILVNQDTTIGPSFEALFVPGRTSAQLAFGLYLPLTGAVVMACAAIGRPEEFDTGFACAWNARLAKDHAKRLIGRALRDRATLIYGHCPQQWSDMRKAPEWYT